MLSTLSSRARRELIVFASAIACGLFLVPLLIWVVGNRVLGPYTHGQDPRAGGPFVLLGDFLTGLVHGSLIFWGVALGPALILLFVRLLYAFYRYRPATPKA
jgi:hypothetical protein